MVNIAHLIPIFPFLAFVINIMIGRRLNVLSAIVSVLACASSAFVSILVFMNLLNGQGSYSLGKWLTINGVNLDFGVIVDPLSVMMLLVVTIVGTLIQIYSIGYMKDDPRFSRYFAYISLFTASMLGLVLADNIVMMFLFWEGVGLCSYLLVSFWYEKPAAVNAGIKAFVTTRVGDTGFLIGIFLLFFATKTFAFSQLSSAVAMPGTEGVLILATLLIFCGAIGKSAQFPLHVWLPDAMEGPTAVSALIHAATMVAAGVYLVARSYVLFAHYPICLETVGVIGAISALLAATMATVNNDIKRVLAYSTVSQLGLMMLGLGVGGYTAGTFHLMTHAFFKALLFLCAGSVIHAVHTQDMRQMGGLLSKMKITGTTFILGTLALAGVPPFAGFWSKDEILSEALKSQHIVLFAVAVLTSFLTAFYMSRLIFLVLFGNPRSKLHAHESPATMTFPLMVLAFFAVVIGLIGSPFANHAFQQFIHFGNEPHAIESNAGMMILSTIISLSGIGLAYFTYIIGNRAVPDFMANQCTWFYKLVENKYYFDEIYDQIFVKPCAALGRFLSSFDSIVVDGIVNGVATMAQWFSSILRPMQSGLVQNYLLVQVLGLIVILTIVGTVCFRF